MCVIKQNIEFWDYKTCLEANHLEKEINLEKNNIVVDSLREKHKDFIKNNRPKELIKEVNKIALSIIDDKRI